MEEMNTKKTSKDGKLKKYLKSTIRILIKARDLYIRSMTECSDKVAYANVMGCPAGQPISLPRSYSVSSTKSSNDDDFRELVRAASTRGLGRKIDQDLLCKQQVRQTPTTGSNNMGRSYSVGPVGIGRIDEDKPCDDFDKDVKVKINAYPRSRSHTGGKRNGMF